jgi:hypothetical protein
MGRSKPWFLESRSSDLQSPPVLPQIEVFRAADTLGAAPPVCTECLRSTSELDLYNRHAKVKTRRRSRREKRLRYAYSTTFLEALEMLATRQLIPDSQRDPSSYRPYAALLSDSSEAPCSSFLPRVSQDRSQSRLSTPHYTHLYR